MLLKFSGTEEESLTGHPGIFQEEKSGSASLQFAACLLLVAHAEELKSAGTDSSTPASSGHGPSLREIVTGYGTTCFEVFRHATKMLQTAAGREWFQSLHDHKEAFTISVKEIMSKFLILTITFKKLEKVRPCHDAAAMFFAFHFSFSGRSSAVLTGLHCSYTLGIAELAQRTPRNQQHQQASTLTAQRRKTRHKRSPVLLRPTSRRTLIL